MRMCRLCLVLSALWMTACGAGWADGGGPGLPANAPIRDCSVHGEWNGMIRGGMLAGRMVSLTFYSEGLARGMSGQIRLDVEYQYEDNTLTIVHHDADPPPAGCPVSQVGVYRLDFSPDCGNVTAYSVSDPCEHRRRTLDRLRARRQ